MPKNSKFESDLPVLGPFEKLSKMMPVIVGMSRGSLCPEVAVLSCTWWGEGTPEPCGTQ